MSDINDPRIPEQHSDAMDESAPCFCGGLAIWHTAGGPGDTSHIHCSNRRCGRIVPAEGRTIAEAIRLWNLEVKQESCDPHGYVVRDGGGYVCPHCDKVFTEKEIETF